ncbi:uncharacterized protein LOC110931128 [Helianthus annuus]|uniref:uncharacterized protein LOC110931128 n=1 Tax=Helianthus annuus TaxID=4232 RepID=UPI000B901694|nr:uncharacterized protein LOC110931128 [Helianthus annuus]
MTNEGNDDDTVPNVTEQMKEMPGVTGGELASQLTKEMEAKISEEVGKAIEASLPQFVERLQPTILLAVEDMITELKDSLSQEKDDGSESDVDPRPVKKSKLDTPKEKVRSSHMTTAEAKAEPDVISGEESGSSSGQAGEDTCLKGAL